MTTQEAKRARTAFGQLLRHRRASRGLSQLGLAGLVGTSPRHLSFIETGRSRPRREMVLRLAEVLDVPLRERNEWLGAAGLPPEYPQQHFESAALAPYRRAIDHMLGALDPYPAYVLDRTFTVVAANRAAERLLPGRAPGRGVNLLDAFLGSGPARELLANFDEVAWAWHGRLLREAATAASGSELAQLLARVEGYLRDLPRPLTSGAGDPVICPTFRIDGQIVKTIGMTARFGPSRDVTLQELCIDMLYPRDDAAERFFRALAGDLGAGAPGGATFASASPRGN
jgi:transcriptional regulator with XRE-family HTH domain